TEATAGSMRLLLDRGADVNARDSLGTPVVTHALRAMQLDQVESLLDRGADPRAKNRLGQSFANVLEELMARQIPGSPAFEKMTEIRDRIRKEGVPWPPPSPEIERERKLTKAAPSPAHAARAVDNAATMANSRGANGQVMQMLTGLLGQLQQMMT